MRAVIADDDSGHHGDPVKGAEAVEHRRGVRVGRRGRVDILDMDPVPEPRSSIG